jgi:hypothetical protein
VSVCVYVSADVALRCINEAKSVREGDKGGRKGEREKVTRRDRERAREKEREMNFRISEFPVLHGLACEMRCRQWGTWV